MKFKIILITLLASGTALTSKAQSSGRTGTAGASGGAGTGTGAAETTSGAGTRPGVNGGANGTAPGSVVGTGAATGTAPGTGVGTTPGNNSNLRIGQVDSSGNVIGTTGQPGAPNPFGSPWTPAQAGTVPNVTSNQFGISSNMLGMGTNSLGIGSNQFGFLSNQFNFNTNLAPTGHTNGLNRVLQNQPGTAPGGGMTPPLPGSNP